MTNEHITHKVHTTHFPELYRKSIEEGELLCADSDRERSFKVVDKDGLVYLLIEARKDYICEEDIVEERHGCFIKKFVVEKDFIGSEQFQQYMEDFQNSITYAMILSSNKTHFARYKYIWARKEKGQDCLIAEYLNLKLVDEYCDIQIYKSGELNNGNL
ncbi:MAG: hypothetical protein K5778_05560 [Bacteroidaceae bacterium]|nr:hypothetical protein [Bacteroidaceae bacterium]